MGKDLTITHFYLLRFGAFTADSKGDYYDNLFKDQWLSIAHCVNEKNTFLVEGFNLPLRIFSEISFWDVAQQIGEYINIDVSLEFAIGLIRSTFDCDEDGLIDAGISQNSINIFDEVEAFCAQRQCHYSICSRTDFINEPIFDLKDRLVLLSADIKCSLSDLYGRVDEDQTWLVLVHHN